MAPSNDAALAARTADPMGSALARFDRQRYNLAAPVTVLDRVPPMHRISVRVVEINPATDTYQIPGPGNKVGLSKTALDRIAAAAGIQWIPDRCGRIDDRRDPYFVTYRAVGILQDFDGRTRVISAEKTLDLRGKKGDPEEKLGADTIELIRIAERAGEKYGKARDPWGQIAQVRQQIHSLAESKAKNRAIRSALGVPVAMPATEAAKPFVVPALVPDLDPTDPQVKAALLAQITGASAALYGAPALPSPTLAPAPAEPEIFDAEVEEDTAPPDAPPAPAADAEPWDDAPADPCPLPVPAEVYMARDDKAKTANWFQRINLLATQALEKGLEAQVREIAAGFDPGAAGLAEIAAVGGALKDLLAGK